MPTNDPDDASRFSNLTPNFGFSEITKHGFDRNSYGVRAKVPPPAPPTPVVSEERFELLRASIERTRQSSDGWQDSEPAKTDKTNGNGKHTQSINNRMLLILLTVCYGKKGNHNIFIMSKNQYRAADRSKEKVEQEKMSTG